MDTNHRTRWTQEENALLESLWDPASVDVLAELFGRTEDAVRQHHYELTWGTAPRAPLSKDVTVKTRVASTAVRRSSPQDRPLGKVCGTCFVELPMHGGCDTCS